MRLRRWSASAGVAVLLVLLALAVLASLAWGARDTAVDGVRGAGPPRPGDNDHLVVLDLRLPRTVVGLLGGLALGMVGALLQGLTRNPIADPGLLGINAGASPLVLLAITSFDVASANGYVWFAFAGAAVAGLVVFGAASLGSEGVTPVKLALVGAAFTAVTTSLITPVLLDDIDAQVAAAAKEHPEFEGKSIAAVAVDPRAFYVYKGADSRVQFLEDLGFTLAPSVSKLSTDEASFFYTLSLENLDQLQSDVLVSYSPSQQRAEQVLRLTCGMTCRGTL